MAATGPVFTAVVPWGAIMLFTAVIGVASLAMLDYSPKSVFIDL